MKKVIVKVEWEERNFGAVCDQVNGVVICTHKNFEQLKKEFKEAFEFHIEQSVADGDAIEEDYVKGNYEFVFDFDTSALLHIFDGILTRSALARTTGINEKQLGHYAQGKRKPRPEQRQKIINGMHRIGKELLAVV